LASGINFVRIIGYRRAIEEIDPSHLNKSDDETRQALLERLSKKD
jgi:hypothetical protein